MRQNKDVWVTASDVGAAEYCPYQLYLKKKGVQPDSSLNPRLQRGNESHNTFKQRHKRVSRTAVVLYFIAVIFMLLWWYLR